ncbi:MAG: DMT family transporter [Pararhodobacter sp.]|nr:DMT family transporter [Pararhodobacter sp.]
MNALNKAPLLTDNRPVAGVLWVVLAGLLFVVMTAVVKHMGPGIPPAQAAFLRYVLGLVFLVPLLPAIIRQWPDAGALKLFGARGLVHSIAVILWFYAMTRITLAEVTAMNYLTPVYVTIGAVIFLGEKLRTRRIVAVLVAIVGAMIMLRPGFRELSSGHLAMLGMAVLMAMSYLLAKNLTRRHSPSMVVAMMSLTVTIGLVPFALPVWIPVTAVQLGWLFLVAFLATAGHYAMTRALAAAPVSVTQPALALQLVWAVTLGAVVFGEAVDMFVVLGGSVIVAAVIFIALREQALRRAAARRDAANDSGKQDADAARSLPFPREGL